jgi:hypothetical protein
MFNMDRAEFEDAIAEYVPQSKRPLIMEALDGDENHIELLGRQLSGDSPANSFMVVTARRDPSTTSVWQAVKSEIFDLFCSESKRYEEERKGGKGIVKKTIHAIGLIVAANFNIGLAVVSPIVTLGLMLALKIGKNAWCALADTPFTPTRT